MYPYPEMSIILSSISLPNFKERQVFSEKTFKNFDQGIFIN